jgi:hypothetical protein
MFWGARKQNSIQAVSIRDIPSDLQGTLAFPFEEEVFLAPKSE